MLKKLKLFITNPVSDFYVRKISKLTGESPNGVRRELAHLEKAGLVKSHREGNLKYYSLVQDFPFYPELKRIIYATVGLGDYISARFKEPQQIELAFIYGSVVKKNRPPTIKNITNIFAIFISYLLQFPNI